MPGLARTDDRTFVAAMTAINAAVQNPLFALAFFGSGLSSAAALVASLSTGGGLAPWAIAGSLALAVLQYAVTFGRNIPLNLRLDREAHGPLVTARRGFERPWAGWNVVRMLATSGSLLLLGLALLAL
ncbi:DUF1772 domain-containing protein [Rathayibacter sp. VKM Ac-2878]|nr:DUF1772 domain-containing protein [Rathayibacter sp. VKM Ac-2879]MBF4504606.1 DUF1772 domain-containing protein [Rathayibacter sp. VKM Ac-2878]